MATNLLRRVNSFLDSRAHFINAPVPDNSNYDHDQASIFKSTHGIENEFAVDFGNEIPDDYVLRFQNLLNNIHSYVTNQVEGIHLLSCDIAKLKIANRSDRVEFHVVAIRPCAERMGILKLVVYQLLKSAASVEKYVMAILPVKKINEIIKSMGIHDGSENPSIDISFIKTLTPVLFRIDQFIISGGSNASQILQIDTSKFPSASDMNDSAKVNARFGQREQL